MSGFPRFTVRLRLTLLYGGLFLLSGAMLLGINYVLTARLTRPPNVVCVGLGEGPVGAAPAASPHDDPCTGGPEPPRPVGHGDVPPPEGSVRVEIDGVSPVQYLQDQQQRTLRRVFVQSGIALAGMGLASVALGWYLAGRALRPLHEITAAAKRISIVDLHQRIALDGPADELQELADTFDAMLARLEAAMATQKRFVADASHELRTPLAVMRAELEVTLADEEADTAELRRMAGTLHDALAGSERLVNSLLVLARSEGDVALDEDVDLGELAAGVAAAIGAEAAAADMTVETKLLPAPVRGDRALLERMIANLVENGVRHGRAGGAVSLCTAVREGIPTVVVVNDGPAVDPSQGSRIFEPFVRLGERRTGRGVGLGLAIVRAVAAAHGARVIATPRPEGGLQVTASFPSRNEDPPPGG